MAVSPAVLDWLLDSDPALKWQVERDLARTPPSTWEATRARVATEGFGARLLALQGEDGQWAGGAFFPAAIDEREPDADHLDGQPWTATTWSLNALREWGLAPDALAGTAERLAANSRWEYNSAPYWQGEVDACINAYTLANGAWLGADVSDLAQWFVDHQMAEGGWNCEWISGSVRSSFNSTLNALRGILAYEKAGPRAGGAESLAALTAARHAGEEYLLHRGLLHRATTGELVQPWFTALAYPFRWHYSALRALDYFRDAAAHDGAAPDPRLGEAIAVVASDRQEDGTWLQEHRYPGAVWFDVDVAPGEPSKWLTFYATRVLDWWEGSSATSGGRTSAG